MGGCYHSTQYTTDSKETLEKYYKEDAPRFREEGSNYLEKNALFRTELEVISEY
jgi:hypothetical protein